MKILATVRLIETVRLSVFYMKVSIVLYNLKILLPKAYKTPSKFAFLKDMKRIPYTKGHFLRLRIDLVVKIKNF